VRTHPLFPALLFLSLLLPLPRAQEGTAAPQEPSLQAVRGLIGRVLPGKEDRFLLDLLPRAGRERFEIGRRGERILLRGTSPIALAAGLGWYLRHIALVPLSWWPWAPIQAPEELPLPERPVKKECRVRHRFFFNYCTFGYTLPFWGWKEWERLIDWMALNGIDLPLAQTGNEAVWLRVWKKFGLPEDEIRSFFTGPAHLPWHRMANLDRWGGPLPRSFIDGKEALQKKILARERALGMKPVLPAFAGHVPPGLRRLFPRAGIKPLAVGWAGVSKKCATWFLPPKSPLFKKIQVAFLKEQERAYGTDHFYSADPFNEIVPPSWDPEFLKSVSRAIYGGMAEADPRAVWIQMGWIFYNNRNWTPERTRAMIEGVPPGRMVLLDYVCERVEFFRRIENFFGAPFVWCYLGNFGGSTTLEGPLRKVAARLDALFSSKGPKNLFGLGSTLEGLDENQLVYEFVLERPWRDNPITPRDWVRAWARLRAGGADPHVEKAWEILLETAYNDSGIPGEEKRVCLQAKPTTGASGWGSPRVRCHYDNAVLARAWQEMLRARPAAFERDAFRFDLVNLARQVLGNHSLKIWRELSAAYRRGDAGAFRKGTAAFRRLGLDLDRLLATRPEFLLGRWTADARAWAAGPGEEAYYQQNARNIVTTWDRRGASLTDYAARLWQGLTRDYYLARWTALFRRMEDSLLSGDPVDRKSWDKERKDIEWNWVTDREMRYPEQPAGDAAALVKELWRRYGKELHPHDPPLPAGSWKPSDLVAGKPVVLTWDVTSLLKGPGDYLFTFRWEKGAHALQVDWVRIDAGGRIPARDVHPGWTGIENRENTYRIRLGEVLPGRRYLLRASVHGAGGTDSAGRIWVARQ